MGGSVKHLIDMKIDLIYYEDLDCTTPFIVRIRTDNQADAINTRISRGKLLCFLIVYAHRLLLKLRSFPQIQ